MQPVHFPQRQDSPLAHNLEWEHTSPGRCNKNHQYLSSVGLHRQWITKTGQAHVKDLFCKNGRLGTGLKYFLKWIRDAIKVWKCGLEGTILGVSNILICRKIDRAGKNSIIPPNDRKTTTTVQHPISEYLNLKLRVEVNLFTIEISTYKLL